MWTLMLALAAAQTMERIEVVGANLDLPVIAYREYTRLAGAEVAGHLCGYPGMSANDAEFGVALGAIGPGLNRRFEIYRAAETADGCSTPAESETALKAAKQALSGMGIDLDSPTGAVPLTPHADGRAFVLDSGTLAWHSVDTDPYVVEFRHRQVGRRRADLQLVELRWQDTLIEREFVHVPFVEAVGAPGGSLVHEAMWAVGNGSRVAVLGGEGTWHPGSGTDLRPAAWFYDVDGAVTLVERGVKPPLPTRGPEIVVDFAVLGFNPETRQVAGRVTAHLDNFADRDVGASVACDYPGQAETPRSGVRLVLQEVGDPASRVFEVTRAVTDRSDCTPHAVGSAALTAAKSAFAAAGIDISRPPQVVFPDAGGDFHLAVGDAVLDLTKKQAWGASRAFVVGRVALFERDGAIVGTREIP